MMSVAEPGRNLTRRRVLQALAARAVVGGAAVGGWAVNRSAMASGNAAWSYGGADGPTHWGQLSGAYRICALGRHQSRIDLGAAHLAQSGDLALHWQPFTATIRHTGQTI